MDKRFTVIHGPRYNPLTETVILNGVIETESLTRAMAIRAARVGCGHRDGVTVWSNDDHGYRLYERSARKITRD